MILFTVGVGVGGMFASGSRGCAHPAVYLREVSASGCLPRGMCAWGGICLGGVCLGMSTCSPPRRQLQRTVRILLECILAIDLYLHQYNFVSIVVFWFVLRFKFFFGEWWVFKRNLMYGI